MVAGDLEQAANALRNRVEKLGKAERELQMIAERLDKPQEADELEVPADVARVLSPWCSVPVPAASSSFPSTHP